MKRKQSTKSNASLNSAAYKQGAKARRQVAKQARAARQGALAVVGAVAGYIASAQDFARGFWQS